MKGLARNTSQLLFCNRLRQNRHSSGSAQRQHAQCSRPIEHTGGCSPRYLVPRYRPAVARLCASPRFGPRKQSYDYVHDRDSDSSCDLWRHLARPTRQTTERSERRPRFPARAFGEPRFGVACPYASPFKTGRKEGPRLSYWKRCHIGEANRVLSASAPCSPGVEPMASDPRGPWGNATLDIRRSIQTNGEHE
jgi:hypothetical protein